MHSLTARLAGSPPPAPSPSRRRGWCRLVVLVALLALSAAPQLLSAQSRVGHDSSTRTRRYLRDLAYGTVLGFGWAGVDQLNNNPPEWGKGWRGYGKRAASDIGEFVIQETVTDALAAALDRPLDYRLCHCARWSQKFRWALRAAVTDPRPDGSNPIAIPRIVGAYTGALAQASWRPSTSSRARTVLTNGTISLLIGAGINIYDELRAR
jgi:hypothetical protein